MVKKTVIHGARRISARMAVGVVVAVAAAASIQPAAPPARTLPDSRNVANTAATAPQGLNAQYWSYSNEEPESNPASTKKSVRRVDPNINFDWGNTAPASGINPQLWNAMYTGQIIASTTGTYTFTIQTFDRVQLYIAGKPVIYNSSTWYNHTATGTVDLTAGTPTDILLSYGMESQGRLQLSWQGPSVAKQIVPQSALRAVVKNGLTGRNFNFTNNWVPTNASAGNSDFIDYDWGTGQPNPSTPADFFQTIWNGQVVAPVTGTYTFKTISDDGVKLWINGQLIVNHYILGGSQQTGTINLTAGQSYDVQIYYFEGDGNAQMHLRWSAPGLPEQVVPSSALSNN